MCDYGYLAYFPKYREYAIERAYECMDHADYYSLDILKDILVIVNKYTPDEQKQKIKSSKKNCRKVCSSTHRHIT